MKLNKLLGVLCLLGGLVLTGCKDNNPPEKTYVSVGVGYDVVFAAGKGGKYTYSLHVATAGFNDEGKILTARVDVIDLTVKSTDGVIALTNSTSKLELGDTYGMKKDNNKGELDTQAEAFATWCIGKTAAEVKACYDANGTGGSHGIKASDETLTATVTVGVSGFANAIYDAYTRKGAKVEYTGTLKAGVGITSSIKTNTTDTFTVEFAGALLDGDKIIACYADEIENGFSGEGTVVSCKVDKYYTADGAFKSKKVLGTAYGMSGIGKVEWDVQVGHIEKAFVGHNYNEDTYFATLLNTTDNYGYMVNDNIEGSVSIYAGGIFNNLKKACKHASVADVYESFYKQA